jgi:hypothetical protein
LVAYDRCGGEYRLEQESYVTLISHANFIPPTTHSRRSRGFPNPYSRPLSRSSMPLPSSYVIANPTSGTFSCSCRDTGTRSPSRPIQPTLSSSPLTLPDIREIHWERSTSYGIPRRNERTPLLLPYDGQPSPSDPRPDLSPVAISTVFLLCCFGALGYGGYRLFLLRQWAWDRLRAGIWQLARSKHVLKRNWSWGRWISPGSVSAFLGTVGSFLEQKCSQEQFWAFLGVPYSWEHHGHSQESAKAGL